MLIERKHPITDIVNTKDINITEEQLNAWKSGKAIQLAAPHLGADDREFIISGLLPSEWDELFPEDEE